MTPTPTTPRRLPPRRPKAQIVVGSIIERPRIKKDGTAYTTFRVQYNSPLDGVPIERTFSTLSYGTKRKAKLAAETWLGTEREKMRTGAWVDPREPVKVDPSRITVAEVAEQWAATWNDRPLSAKTQLGYRALLDGRVLPRWGRVRVGSITSQDVQAWLRDLAKQKPNPGNNHKRKPTQKLHPTTIRRTYAVLQLVLGHAEYCEYIAQNPCRRAKVKLPPSSRNKVGMALTWSDLRALVNAVPEQWRTPLALTVVTGLRSSELWGLCRRDWDPKTGTVTVRQTLHYIGGEFIAAPGKTEASEAAVSVPASLHAPLTAAATAPGIYVRSLRNSRQRGYPAMIERDGSVELGYVTDPADERRLLFTVPTGQPVHHANFYRRQFRPAATALWPDAADRRHHVRFHDLRHSHGTNVLYETDNPVLVQKRLRHSQLAITVDLYGRHADEAHDRLLASRIDAAWSGNELAQRRAKRAASK